MKLVIIMERPRNHGSIPGRGRRHLFPTRSRPVLGPTQSPIQWVPGSIYQGVKRPGHEADHTPPSSAKVKNVWSYTSTPLSVFMAQCLIKHRENFASLTLQLLLLFPWFCYPSSLFTSLTDSILTSVRLSTYHSTCTVSINLIITDETGFAVTWKKHTIFMVSSRRIFCVVRCTLRVNLGATALEYFINDLCDLINHCPLFAGDFKVYWTTKSPSDYCVRSV
jgi:hypothetical protein